MVPHVLSSYICNGGQYLSANEKWAERKLPGLAEVQAALEHMFEELNNANQKNRRIPTFHMGVSNKSFLLLIDAPFDVLETLIYRCL
ncbi:MAG: hypothetical protein C6W54_14260 [Bacillaceae bacterium]|nr:MAG: hypothetical protein C6W54_14260 [Bacillaceae bacterium]